MSSDSSSMSSSPSSSSSTCYSSWSPSSTKSARSSPVHAASLVDPSKHSPELMQLVDIELSRPVIGYVVGCVSEAVDYAFGRPARSSRSRYHKKFSTFVANMFSRAEVAPATVLVALVYIARARAHLTIALEEWALERVFLGALIVASKYTQDSTLKNVHWALCTGIFGRGDIGRIEREFLEVIDWELGVQESDLLAHHEGLVAAASGVQFEARVNVKLAPAKAEVEEMDVQELAISPPYSPPSPAGAVPELEPSSPQSSAGSLSPRTPVSHAVLPMDVDVALPATSPPPAPRPNSKKRAHAHAHRCKRLHSFLHSFHPHHHQHHHAVEVAA